MWLFEKKPRAPTSAEKPETVKQETVIISRDDDFLVRARKALDYSGLVGIDINGIPYKIAYILSKYDGLDKQDSVLPPEEDDAEQETPDFALETFPYAAMFVDHTGCEHLSRDVENIERIAEESGCRSSVTYFYRSQKSVPVLADDEDLAALRKHCEVHAGKSRATFSVDRLQRVLDLIDGLNRESDDIAFELKVSEDRARFTEKSLREKLAWHHCEPISEPTDAKKAAADESD